ncbi:H/ACA ribonucleoprotein complex non-core subunit NAF1 [Dermacentor albipictus]|uniref:H/ACA ribonucleoprotein complex non-core subunit NAF1 n=1 Tax=Dermacentor albipictus TaxID=60249 RepID=UPI0031FBB1A4
MDTTTDEPPASHESNGAKVSCNCAENTNTTNHGASVTCDQEAVNGSGTSLIDDVSQAGAAERMQNGCNENVLDAVLTVAVGGVSLPSACEKDILASKDATGRNSAYLSSHALPASDDIADTVNGTQADLARVDVQPSIDGTGTKNNMECFSHQLTSLQLNESAGDVASADRDGIDRAIVNLVWDILGRVDNSNTYDAAVVCSSTDTDSIRRELVGVEESTAVSLAHSSPGKAQTLSKAPLAPYRNNGEDMSADSSSSSSSSSDSDVDVVVTQVQRRPPKRGEPDDCSDGGEVDGQGSTTKHCAGRGGGRPRYRGVKTPGELDIEDLPPIEDLHITLPRTELRQAGRVKHAVDQLLVVETERGQPVLDLDSVLFRADGTALGRVFDVLGPVAAPYYTVRFNSAQELTERALEPGEPVLYAPLHADVTQYVLESEVRKQRGSDASWENNNEPPPEHLDFSDDEQEREVRKQLRASRTAAYGGSDGTGDRPGGDQRPRGAPRGRGRGRGRGAPRGGHNREQQPRHQPPEAASGGVRSHTDGPPMPVYFQESRSRPQWPPSLSPQQRWPGGSEPARFQPNVPPLTTGPSQLPWPASPQCNNSGPNIWNTPPPSLSRPPPLPWQQSRQWLNQPPAFPDLRTPPPNFGCAVSSPCPPRATFASPHSLHANTAVGRSGYRQASAVSHPDPSALPSPVYNSAGHRVPLYDPVPDLQRILATPPPPPPPLKG